MLQNEDDDVVAIASPFFSFLFFSTTTNEMTDKHIDEHPKEKESHIVARSFFYLTNETNKNTSDELKKKRLKIRWNRVNIFRN